MDASTDRARRAAWDALAALDEERSDRLAEVLSVADLDGTDAAFAHELAFGALRHAILYDHLASRFLRKGRQPPVLTRALRLACHQLFGLDQIPPYAVGQTTVDLLKEHGTPHLCGVANAVIRILAGIRLEHREGEGPLGRLAAADWPEIPAIRHGLPRQLVEDLASVLPEDQDRALAALTLRPPLCTRQRPGRPIFRGRSVIRSEGPWMWWSDPLEALRGPVADGLCVVQDRTQGRVVEMAKPRPGQRVCDCSVAQNGKAQAFLDAGCRVIAAERDLAKARRVAEGAHEGLGSLVQDLGLPALADGGFDMVVLEAPCSDTGILARRPEAIHRYDRRLRDDLVGHQRKLLRSAARLVADDGRLIYATCSLVPMENQGVAHRLGGWRILAEHLTWPDAWQTGGYVAVLVRSVGATTVSSVDG